MYTYPLNISALSNFFSEIRFVNIKMGVSPGWGGGARLVRLVGRQQGLRMLGTAQKINMKEAIECGLVDGELQQEQVCTFYELIQQHL